MCRYDHPLKWDPLDAKLCPEDPDKLVDTNGLALVVRPRKDVLHGVDHVHSISFRKDYPDGEAELQYQHVR